MRILLSAISILIAVSSFSQKQTSKLNISWQNPGKIVSGTDTMIFLSFDDAIVESNASLPLAEYKILLQPDEIVNALTLKEQMFAELSSDEQQIFSSLHHDITDSLRLKLKYETCSKKVSAVFSFFPFRLNSITGKVEKLLSAEIEYNISKKNTSSENKHVYAENSVLSDGSWYKMKIKDEGIYQITYNDLVQLGIDVSSCDPRKIKIFGNGGGMLPEANWLPAKDDLLENSIYISGEEDGIFDPADYILFFGQSAHKWNYDTMQNHFVHTNNIYSDYTYYFLTIGANQGKRVIEAESETGTADFIVTKFDDYCFHEKDSVNLLKSGKQWYGEYFDAVNSYDFNFNFPDLDLTAEAYLKINIAARNTDPTNFIITADTRSDSINVFAIPGQATADYARFTEDTLYFSPDSDDIQIAIEKTTQNSIGWLNYIELNVTRNLSFRTPQMGFRNVSCSGPGKISEFKLANASNYLSIWNVSDPGDIRNHQYVLSGSEAIFSTLTDSLKEFVAFDGSAFLYPGFMGSISNQNLHGLQSPDMIIVSYPDFIAQANRLALLHQTVDNFNVAVVTPQQIYNEFSSGMPDITAIRNFMRMFYDRAHENGTFPKYLLLFGDASYDYKDRLPDNTNLVPTYQSNNSLVPVSSYLTDDYFGILDSLEGYYSNGALDMGIGRLPAKTEEEAKTLVDKIEAYLVRNSTYSETNGCNTYSAEITGDWRNLICFIADDEDNNLHIEQVETITGMVESASPEYNISKIYLDAYQQQTTSMGPGYPDVNELLNKRVEQGSLFINYTGHGGETGWSYEKILQLSDIFAWKNIHALPAFVTATCEFSRFDEPSRTSAGEYVLLSPDGGGIALFTTTRVAFAYSNFNLNKSFCKEALTKDSLNEFPRLGDIIMNSKISNGSVVNIRNFVLLGDPALRLSYPENKVVTTEINGHAIFSEIDTIGANELVTIKGIIQDKNGQKIENFNGTVYPTVFDKKIIQTTLANDQTSTPYNFLTQDNIIYKGKTSVVDGDFEFSFVVPKDIAVNYGQARISYYAKDSLSDAGGYLENADFIIGGIDSTAIPDNEGPVIRLFFNDTSFTSGSVTDENPILIALLQDSSGIQYTGYGIGHDIIATLDGNTTADLCLNDFFVPEMNSFRKGEVKYPFKVLSEGEHTLTLKAWDIANNPSEANISFIVTKPGDLSLKNIFNYPNPFSESTCFYFEHNQPCCDIEVEVEIYSMTGLRVKRINETIATNGNKYSTLCWNGRNDAGNILNSGAYIYKIKIITANKSWLESAGRLIILK